MTAKIDGTNGVLQQYDYQVPTTGFSYTFAAGTTVLVMNPAGTLATGTITMPASPVDGMTITIVSTQQITALTLNGNTGQSIVSNTTFIAAGSATAYVYRLSNTTWYPFNSIPKLVNVPIGVGQTWTDVTASRAGGTTYTNSTGKPILVVVTVNQTGSFVLDYTVTVAGVVISRAYAGTSGQQTTAYIPTTFIVPNGSTYLLTMTAGVLNKWVELR